MTPTPTWEETDGIRHHPVYACDGEPCPFHSPSDHPMVEWPMCLRASTLIERLCKHGVGHPDPDSVAWFERHGLSAFGEHGCDGCCRGPGPPPPSSAAVAELISDLREMSEQLESELGS